MVRLQIRRLLGDILAEEVLVCQLLVVLEVVEELALLQFWVFGWRIRVGPF